MVPVCFDYQLRLQASYIQRRPKRDGCVDKVTWRPAYKPLGGWDRWWMDAWRQEVLQVGPHW